MKVIDTLSMHRVNQDGHDDLVESKMDFEGLTFQNDQKRRKRRKV